METFVSTLFIVFCLINIVKLGDLIVRPHQQKWFQDKLETLTLKLDYLNTLNWFKRNINSRFILIIGFIGFLFTFPFFHKFVNFLGLHFQENLLLSTITGFISIFIFRRMRQIIGIDYIVGKDTEVDEYIYETTTFRSRAFSVVLKLWIIMKCLLILYATVVYLLYKYLIHKELDVLLYGLWFITPFLATWLALILSFILMGITTILVYLLHILIKILDGICWRIIEYNKGSLAAICLIITVILGLIEWFLKK